MQGEETTLSGGDMLSDSFGFQLKMLQVESDARARAALAPFDISPARVAAMMIIAANPGCTQTRLGDTLSVNRASAMKLVNFLESRGLVARKQASDPRANALYVTRKGTGTLAEMRAALHAADKETLAALNEEEASKFAQLLRKIRVGSGSMDDAIRGFASGTRA